ncbi:MAG: hypothetical protein K2K11_03560, partial [Bacteroidales bacterium]|nr:hypothetical protein [Bacteroidales bacterium]
HIYMAVKPGDVFTSFTSSNILALRRILEDRVELSDNISGRGNLVFRLGKASVEDSTWFVQNGWTVNQKLY